MSDPKGPIKVWDMAQLGLAAMGFTRARCQKWVNIKLYLMKNRRKQRLPASWKEPSQPNGVWVQMIQKPQSHDPTKEIFQTSPKKITAWLKKKCYQTHLSLTQNELSIFSPRMSKYSLRTEDCRLNTSSGEILRLRISLLNKKLGNDTT